MNISKKHQKTILGAFKTKLWKDTMSGVLQKGVLHLKKKNIYTKFTAALLPMDSSLEFAKTCILWLSNRITANHWSQILRIHVEKIPVIIANILNLITKTAAMYLNVGERIGMLRVLSSMVGRQETFLNCRSSTLAKTAIS